jgi:hypothetical protein
MFGEDLVRAWKDPDERGEAVHPAGEITLDAIRGALGGDYIDTMSGNSCFLDICTMWDRPLR